MNYTSVNQIVAAHNEHVCNNYALADRDVELVQY